MAIRSRNIILLPNKGVTFPRVTIDDPPFTIIAKWDDSPDSVLDKRDIDQVKGWSEARIVDGLYGCVLSPGVAGRDECSHDRLNILTIAVQLEVWHGRHLQRPD